NLGAEEQKGGCRPADAGALADRLTGLGLVVEGLMTVPPQLGDPRPYFASLRELATSLGLQMLSLGMSGDYAVAIADGATIAPASAATRVAPARTAPAESSPVTVFRGRHGRDDDEPPVAAARSSAVKAIPMPTTRVHVMDPRGFNDAQEVGDRLKNGQPVILN